jgi:hypothetical protein
MSDSRDLVLDFWKNKGTYIEKYGFAYSKEDIKVLLNKLKKQGNIDAYNKVIELLNSGFDKKNLFKRVIELKEGVEK